MWSPELCVLVGVIKQGSKWAKAEGSIIYSQAELARYRVQAQHAFLRLISVTSAFEMVQILV